MIYGSVTEKDIKRWKWDKYFLRIAKEIASNSKCLSRQIGAVLVKDKSIISTGYNGPARGIKHCNERYISFYENINMKTGDGNENIVYSDSEKDYFETLHCPRKQFGYKSGEGLHLCQAGHAERNALIQAARHGISTKGTTLYCYCGQICKDCAIEIINAGIDILVYLRNGEYDGYSGTILEESEINIWRYKKEGLDD